MERNRLEDAVNLQISSELKLYKMIVLQKTKEEILADAFQIANMIEMYETFVEVIPHMTDREIYECLQVSGLLFVVYEKWLKIPDDENRLKESCVWSFLGRTSKNAT